MTAEDLTNWALANGWQMIAGHPSLTKPSAPKEAIVRLILKATVAQLEAKKPAGKWEKLASAPYASIEMDPIADLPTQLGFTTVQGFRGLMEDNKHRAVFANFPKSP